MNVTAVVTSAPALSKNVSNDGSNRPGVTSKSFEPPEGLNVEKTISPTLTGPNGAVGPPAAENVPQIGRAHV